MTKKSDGKQISKSNNSTQEKGSTSPGKEAQTAQPAQENRKGQDSVAELLASLREQAKARAQPSKHPLRKPFNRMRGIAKGLEVFCRVECDLFGDKTEEVIEFCGQRDVPRKFSRAEISSCLNLFRTIRNILRDDIDRVYPAEYDEHYWEDLEAIKWVFLNAFDHELKVVSRRVSRLY